MSHQIFFRVIDAAGFDQELEEIFVLGKALESVRRAGAREALEDFQAITFQPGIAPTQKGELVESA